MIEWLEQLYTPNLALFSTALLVLSAYAVGVFVIRNVLDIKMTRPCAAFAICIITGLDLIMFATMVLGYSKLLSPAVFWIFLFCGGTTGAALLGINGKHIFPAFSRQRYLLIFILPLFVIMLAPALCPPVGWDELVYHISVPYRWVSQGYPAVYLDNPYSAFPSGAEMLFWILIATGGITAPGILLWFLLLITACSVFAMLNNSKNNPYLAIILVLAMCLCPVFLMLARECFVETVILVNITIFLLLSRKPEEPGPVNLAILAGIFAGASVAVKLTGASAAVAIFVLLLFQYKTSLRKSIEILVVFCVISGAFALPFYLRPWLLTGNPFYPYFNAWFISRPGALVISSYHHAIGNARYGAEGIAGLFTTPVLMAYDSDIYDGGFGWQFPALVILAALGLVIGIQTKARRAVVYIAGALIIYLFWFFTAQQARFLIPLLPLVILLSAYSVDRLPKQFTIGMLGAVAFLTAVSIQLKPFRHYAKCWGFLTGKVKVADFIYTGTGPVYLESMAMSNIHVPENGRVMLLYENRGLYLPRDYVIGTPGLQEKYFPIPPQTPEELLKSLHKAGITHVLIGLSSKDPDTLKILPQRNEKFHMILYVALQRGYLKQLWEKQGTDYKLFGVKPPTQ